MFSFDDVFNGNLGLSRGEGGLFRDDEGKFLVASLSFRPKFQ